MAADQQLLRRPPLVLERVLRCTGSRGGQVRLRRSGTAGGARQCIAQPDSQGGQVSRTRRGELQRALVEQGSTAEREGREGLVGGAGRVHADPITVAPPR